MQMKRNTKIRIQGLLVAFTFVLYKWEVRTEDGKSQVKGVGGSLSEAGKENMGSRISNIARSRNWENFSPLCSSRILCPSKVTRNSKGKGFL